MFEDPTTLIIILTSWGVFLGAMVVCVLVVRSRYKSIPPGQALVVTKTNGTTVRRNGGMLVMPGVHSSVWIDLSVRKVVVQRSGAEGLLCRDGIRVDCAAEFLVRVNSTDEDILSVAQKIGAERANDPATLDELFAAKFVDALAAVAAQLEFDELLAERERFRDHVLEVVGQDLGGYVLDDVAIASLGQTSLSALDPDNIKDAQGIRRITERVEQERIETTRLRLESEETVRRMEAEAAEKLAAMDAERATAEARARAHVETARAQAEAEVAVAEAEALDSASEADDGKKPSSLQPWRLES